MGLDIGDIKRKVSSFWKRKGMKEKLKEALLAKEKKFKVFVAGELINRDNISLAAAQMKADVIWEIIHDFIDKVL